LIGNDENLIVTTLKPHYDIKTAILYIFLSTKLTRALLPKGFAVYVEICRYFDFLKIHLKLI